MRPITLATLFVFGCTARSVSDVPTNPTGETYTTFDVANRNVDILFVIDNSGSMLDEQQALIANFDDFMAVLRNIEGGLPSVHIGVVTSNVGIAPFEYAGGNCFGGGQDGVLQNGQGSCSIAGRYIIDTPRGDGTREVNYGGTLEEAFGCIAEVGAGGCGFEQHLEATRRALIDKRSLENTGFLRDDAYLAVIIVADEDDCSAADPLVFDPTQTDDADPLGAMTDFRCVEFGVTCAEGDVARGPGSYTNCVPRDGSFIRHPDEIVDDILGLKPSRDLILVAGITGNPEPFRIVADAQGHPRLDYSCSRTDPQTGTVSSAEPAPRLRYFLDQFDNSTSASICDDPFDIVLTGIAEKLIDRLRPCLRGHIDLTDLFPDEPGLQPDCQISDVRFLGTDQQVETPIARCPMLDPSTPDTSITPCWWVDLDPSLCTTTETGLALHVERANSTPPIGTQLVARCLSD